MKSPAQKYNYRYEALLACITTVLFVATIIIGDRFPALPIHLIAPKTLKKKGSRNEEDEEGIIKHLTDSTEKELLRKALPDASDLKLAMYSANQARMIIKDYLKHNPFDSLTLSTITR